VFLINSRINLTTEIHPQSTTNDCASPFLGRTFLISWLEARRRLPQILAPSPERIRASSRNPRRQRNRKSVDADRSATRRRLANRRISQASAYVRLHLTIPTSVIHERSYVSALHGQSRRARASRARTSRAVINKIASGRQRAETCTRAHVEKYILLPPRRRWLSALLFRV
jgi:hypothetical protein